MLKYHKNIYSWEDEHIIEKKMVIFKKKKKKKKGYISIMISFCFMLNLNIKATW